MVPNKLKKWFLAHFIIDMIFAIPLMFFTEEVLIFIKMENTNLIFARLVGAALFGIGIESLLGNNKGIESYSSLLTLKIIWSFSAIVAFSLSIFKDKNNNIFLWLSFFIFIIFNIAWVYWKLILLREKSV